MPTGLDDALSASKVYPLIFVFLDWPSGPVRVWNGNADITWNGFTWLGMSSFGGISDISESSDGSANGITLTLSGVPSENISDALANDAQGRSAQIYFGVVSTDTVVIDPYLLIDAFIDTCSIADDGKAATITVTIELELYDDRSSARRFNDADQRIDYPDDDGFQYVAGLATQTMTWGAASPTLPAMSISDPNAGLTTLE